MREGGHRGLAIGVRNELVAVLGDFTLESIPDFVFDHACDGPLEEALEQGCKVAPDVTADMDVDVIFVNVYHDIDRVDGWHHSSVWQGLRCKLEADSHCHLVEVDFSVASSDEEVLFRSEGTRVELGRKVVARKSDSVLRWIHCKYDIGSGLVECEGVVVEVDLVAVVVGNLHTLDQFDHFVEIDVFGLLDDCDVQRCSDPVGGRSLSESSGAKHTS